MLRMSYEDIIEKIKNEKNISEDEIQDRINKKLQILGDLISKEGAAHIVANEFGVKLLQEPSDKKLKINKLAPGLNFIALDAKVISISNVIHYKNEKREGKVANITIADETGMSRLVLWDSKLIDLIEQNKINEDDIITIRNAYSRENNGFIELHLGGKGDISINPEGVEIKDVNLNNTLLLKEIKDVKENDSIELRGTIVQFFEPKFYQACPECNRKVDNNSCGQHENIVPKEITIVNFFLDDGTDNIRVVAFRDVADKILENKTSLLKGDVNEFESFKNNILGKQVKLSGRAVKNAMFDRMEFRANTFDELNPDILIEELKK